MSRASPSSPASPSATPLRSYVVGLVGGRCGRTDKSSWRDQLEARLASASAVTLVDIGDPAAPGEAGALADRASTTAEDDALDALDTADTVVVCFDREPPAPLALLALGRAVRGQDTIVFVDGDPASAPAFVEPWCARHGLDRVRSLPELAARLGERDRALVPSEGLSVRRALAADLETLVAFTRAEASAAEGRALDEPRVRAAIAAALQDPTGKATYYIAERGSDAVGHGSTFAEWSDWRNKSYTWVQSMYVAPAARRSGVMTALLEHIAADARADDSPELRIYVHTDNDSALAAWQRVGFRGGAYWMASRPLR